VNNLSILELKGVTKRFGGVIAVKNLDIKVYESEILGIIGPNGSGKTTVFNLITGILKPNSGSIIFKEKDITKCKPWEIFNMGIGRTWQIPRLFLNMSVLENVLIGTISKGVNINEAKKKADCILKLLHMNEKADFSPRILTPKEMKLLEIARAISGDPILLLLDEPFAGLNPKEIEELMDIIKKIKENSGLTVVVIEHVMRAIMALSERIIVMNEGEKICEGTPRAVSVDNRVIEAYLGKRALKVA
jgi:branched-chain amino acid transport system ATP-binding protein